MLCLKAFACLAALTFSGVVAAPWDPTSRHATHRVRSIGPDRTKLTTYHPPGVFETFDTGIDYPLSKRGSGDPSPTEIAQSFLQSKFNLSANEISRQSGHSSENASYEYFNQMLNGIPIANAVAGVTMRNGKVVSYHANFVKPKNIASAQPVLSLAEEIAKAQDIFGGLYNNWPIKLEYLITDTDDAILTHGLQVQNENTGEWYKMSVNTASGQIANVIDFVADASYRALRIDKQDPRDGFEILTDPADAKASPKGWHTKGDASTRDTSGNNVISYKAGKIGISKLGQTFDIFTKTSKESSPINNYDYMHTPDVAPSDKANLDAARTNTFYVANTIHDITYKYGFDEAAHNFQDDNGGKGGAGNDRVQISVQDASGLNNANFATPADGQHGHMRMYIWNYTTPNRDGALENDIITHEYGHGVSNRLTGGGTGQCLQTVEAGGMGEGWSDTLAFLLETKSSQLGDFTLGSYVVNNTRGIRSHPYSTNMTTNPLTYKYLKTQDEVHNIGEYQAVLWYEILSGLMQAFGYSDLNDPTGPGGNVVALHILIESFKEQPCNPTFLSARDATISVAKHRYNKQTECILWAAYAKRGLGLGATRARVNNMDVPPYFRASA